MAEGLWQRRRRRDGHRSRRQRRACFGELVQIDTSTHDWAEGRGEGMALIHMTDDATSRLLARFYPADTTEAHRDLLGRWLLGHGRPLALYSDRHSIFEAQDKGRAAGEGQTQFGRALRELDIELILRSPQAKGRVERPFGTAQDRWVKEMRLAKVRTIAQANELLGGYLLPQHRERFTVAPASPADAHRALGQAHNLAAILRVQHRRLVSNDYVVRLENRCYQLGKPVYPGERGGKVVIELRLDGTMAIRFGGRYLNWQETTPAVGSSGGRCPPGPPEFSALAADASAGGEGEGRASGGEAPASGVQPAGGRWGRTPALPYPPDGGADDNKKGPYRPAANHPWRRTFLK